MLSLHLTQGIEPFFWWGANSSLATQDIAHNFDDLNFAFALISISITQYLWLEHKR